MLLCTFHQTLHSLHGFVCCRSSGRSAVRRQWSSLHLSRFLARHTDRILSTHSGFGGLQDAAEVVRCIARRRNRRRFQRIPGSRRRFFRVQHVGDFPRTSGGHHHVDDQRVAGQNRQQVDSVPVRPVTERLLPVTSLLPVYRRAPRQVSFFKNSQERDVRRVHMNRRTTRAPMTSPFSARRYTPNCSCLVIRVYRSYYNDLVRPASFRIP